MTTGSHYISRRINIWQTQAYLQVSMTQLCYTYVYQTYNNFWQRNILKDFICMHLSLGGQDIWEVNQMLNLITIHGSQKRVGRNMDMVQNNFGSGRYIHFGSAHLLTCNYKI